MGGSVVYAGLTASRLGRRVGVLTSATPDLILEPLLRTLAVECVPSDRNTDFENRYPTTGPREQFIRSVATRIAATDVPSVWRKAPLVLIGPVAGEVDPRVVRCFPESLVCVAPQGWMRRWGGDGQVSRKVWEDAADVLPDTDVLVVSEEDLGGDISLAQEYAKRVPVVLYTMGAKGSRLHWRGAWHDIPSFEVEEVDATGAGDVFAAAFLVRYSELREPLRAALFASCAASFCVEESGYSALPTREQIEARLSSAGRG